MQLPASIGWLSWNVTRSKFLSPNVRATALKWDRWNSFRSAKQMISSRVENLKLFVLNVHIRKLASMEFRVSVRLFFHRKQSFRRKNRNSHCYHRISGRCRCIRRCYNEIRCCDIVFYLPRCCCKSVIPRRCHRDSPGVRCKRDFAKCTRHSCTRIRRSNM